MTLSNENTVIRKSDDVRTDQLLVGLHWLKEWLRQHREQLDAEILAVLQGQQ